MLSLPTCRSANSPRCTNTRLSVIDCGLARSAGHCHMRLCARQPGTSLANDEAIRHEIIHQRDDVALRVCFMNLELVGQCMADLIRRPPFREQLPHARAGRIESVVDATFEVEKNHLLSDFLVNDAFRNGRVHALFCHAGLPGMTEESGLPE